MILQEAVETTPDGHGRVSPRTPEAHKKAPERPCESYPCKPRSPQKGPNNATWRAPGRLCLR
eukprot:4204696-Alexandrium_andersonii.AAC.1